MNNERKKILQINLQMQLELLESKHNIDTEHVKLICEAAIKELEEIYEYVLKRLQEMHVSYDQMMTSLYGLSATVGALPEIDAKAIRNTLIKYQCLCNIEMTSLFEIKYLISKFQKIHETN